MAGINKVGAVGAKGLPDKGGANPPAQYDNGFSKENANNYANLDNKVNGMRKGSSQQGITG